MTLEIDENRLEYEPGEWRRTMNPSPIMQKIEKWIVRWTHILISKLALSLQIAQAQQKEEEEGKVSAKKVSNVIQQQMGTLIVNLNDQCSKLNG